MARCAAFRADRSGRSDRCRKSRPVRYVAYPFCWPSPGITNGGWRTRAFATVYSQQVMMRRLEDASADLERLAATDALTGAASRRHFLNRLHEELAKAERTLEPLSLLMMDIDHFKIVNDRYGHQAGDATLVTFVGGIRDVLRVPDVLGRLGGEEFCPLLVGLSVDHVCPAKGRMPTYALPTLSPAIQRLPAAGGTSSSDGSASVTTMASPSMIWPACGATGR